MRHFRFGTAKSDDGTLRLEDLLALPDVAADAVSEVLESYGKARLTIPPALVVPMAQSVTGKSRYILSWLAHASSRLRKLNYAFEPSGSSKGLVIRRLRFHAH